MICVPPFSSDKLLVVFHVSHKDRINGAQQSPETLPVKLDNLQTSACNDICRTWLILQQSSLPEVVPLFVLVDFGGRLARL